MILRREVQKIRSGKWEELEEVYRNYKSPFALCHSIQSRVEDVPEPLVFLRAIIPPIFRCNPRYLKFSSCQLPLRMAILVATWKSFPLKFPYGAGRSSHNNAKR